MNCRELESFLHPYLDGEFGDDDKSELERHLSECAGCAQKVHVEARFKHSLRSALKAAQPRAPASLRSRVALQLEQQARRPAVPRWTVSAAAAVVLVSSSGYALLATQQRQKYLEDAARHHARSLPLEIAEVPHERVEEWFGGKLDHRVAVPRFRNVRLTGARLSNVSDQPAAYISYDAAVRPGESPRRVGLFVFDDARNRMDAKPLPHVELHSSRGYNVATWKNGEIVYELVTDLDEQDIRHMVVGSDDQGGMPSPSLEVRPASFEQ